ncbi:hypothetical protein SAMN04488128_10278 [Chitinophaga eiseniae]|uniref:TOTE conflict system primase domain-containing protein n=1 Tax=Chitinophaga eiseniae TaxID=634771 RepID=A0A1T4PYM8_9BACT|nr:hypothetical protein [Chitinophaga eiseniae]SJZ96670.1 hypothetical protein SAMN04488128_10278 [Chitinophaga eiseniae]
MAPDVVPGILCKVNLPIRDKQAIKICKLILAVHNAIEITEEKLTLFQSLFKAKEDAFAIRWEKDGKSGYMPSYQMDWGAYKMHKHKGGTFSNFKDKNFIAPYYKRVC